MDDICYTVIVFICCSVAKKKSLFDDKADEIQQLTLIIKQDINCLNKQIAQLQEVRTDPLFSICLQQQQSSFNIQTHRDCSTSQVQYSMLCIISYSNSQIKLYDSHARRPSRPTCNLTNNVA